MDEFIHLNANCRRGPRGSLSSRTRIVLIVKQQYLYLVFGFFFLKNKTKRGTVMIADKFISTAAAIHRCFWMEPASSKWHPMS